MFALALLSPLTLLFLSHTGFLTPSFLSILCRPPSLQPHTTPICLDTTTLGRATASLLSDHSSLRPVRYRFVRPDITLARPLFPCPSFTLVFLQPLQLRRPQHQHLLPHHLRPQSCAPSPAKPSRGVVYRSVGRSLESVRQSVVPSSHPPPRRMDCHPSGGCVPSAWTTRRRQSACRCGASSGRGNPRHPGSPSLPTLSRPPTPMKLRRRGSRTPLPHLKP